VGPDAAVTSDPLPHIKKAAASIALALLAAKPEQV
jgi:hypothetical protein